MARLKHLSDQELADYIALQEKYRDQGEPSDAAAAADKLRDLYVEAEARASRSRLRVVRPAPDQGEEG